MPRYYQAEAINMVLKVILVVALLALAAWTGYEAVAHNSIPGAIVWAGTVIAIVTE